MSKQSQSSSELRFSVNAEDLKLAIQPFTKLDSLINDFRYLNYIYIIIEKETVSLLSYKDDISVKITIPATVSFINNPETPIPPTLSKIYMICATFLFYSIQSTTDTTITFTTNSSKYEHTKFVFSTNGKKYTLNALPAEKFKTTKDLNSLFLITPTLTKTLSTQKLKTTLDCLSSIPDGKSSHINDERINYISIKFLPVDFSDFIATDSIKLGFCKLPAFSEISSDPPSTPCDFLILKDTASLLASFLNPNVQYTTVSYSPEKILFTSDTLSAAITPIKKPYFELEASLSYPQKHSLVTKTDTFLNAIKRIMYFGKDNIITLNIKKTSITISAFNSEANLAASEIIPAQTTFSPDITLPFNITFKGNTLYSIAKHITTPFTIIAFSKPLQFITLYPSQEETLSSKDTFYLVSPILTEPSLSPDDVYTSQSHKLIIENTEQEHKNEKDNSFSYT